MNVRIYERCKTDSVYENVKKIEKQEFHIFITDAKGDVYTHELDDVKGIEVSL